MGLGNVMVNFMRIKDGKITKRILEVQILFKVAFISHLNVVFLRLFYKFRMLDNWYMAFIIYGHCRQNKKETSVSFLFTVVHFWIITVIKILKIFQNLGKMPILIL